MNSDKDYPLVSIGMPTYNGVRYICEAIESLLAQDYPNFELIISDNGSTDETPRICRKYADRNPRIVFYRSETNRGLVYNYNNLLTLASGKYFMWAADDDTREHDYISQCVAHLESHPETVLCHSLIGIIDARSCLQSVKDQPMRVEAASAFRRHRTLLRDVNSVFPIYGIMRTEVAKSTRRIQSYYGSDYGFVSEIALRGNIFQIPRVLFRFRIHREEDLHTYVKRLVSSLAPGSRHRTGRSLRLIVAANLARNVMRTQEAGFAKACMLIDIVFYYIFTYDTILEFHRMTSEILGPKVTDGLERVLRPVWRISRPRKNRRE